MIAGDSRAVVLAQRPFERAVSREVLLRTTIPNSQAPASHVSRSKWRATQKYQCHARESGHPDLAARAAALDSRFRGNDRMKDPILIDAACYGVLETWYSMRRLRSWPSRVSLLAIGSALP